jgi:hypothetical protein
MTKSLPTCCRNGMVQETLTGCTFGVSSLLHASDFVVTLKGNRGIFSAKGFFLHASGFAVNVK